MKIVEPVQERHAFFNGWETEGAFYDHVCNQCHTKNRIVFKDILDAAWGWREKTNPKHRKMIADIFKIDLANRSIGSGMDAIVTKKCNECDATYYVFFWFYEYRHSCYDISLRGIAKNNT
jgi:hypothetical protein